MEDCSIPTCAPECEQVFDRIVISYLIRGGTRISFTTLPTFTDPLPFEAQLQVGTSNNPDAADWRDIGLPVTNQYVLMDDQQRVWGKANWTHYRIVLTTPNGTYTSPPQGGMGVLDYRDWRLAQDMVRQRLVAYRYGPGGQVGYLLKRRQTGTPCPTCLDFQTGEVRNSDCPDCYGTGYKCGYFFPIGCVWAETNPRAFHNTIDTQARGHVKDIFCKTEMLGIHLLDEDDIWVNKRTDDRWFIHEVQHTAEYRGIPLVANVTLRLVPYSSNIYTIAIPDQDAALES